MNTLPPDLQRAPLVPELLVSNLERSLTFWCDLCGFSIAYDRPEDRFAYLDRAGCQVMLEEVMGPGRRWMTGQLDQPFGRGMNLQISVADIEPIRTALEGKSWPLYLEPETKWYRAGLQDMGVLQFIVQDPDGYLLRFSQSLGLRQAT